MNRDGNPGSIHPLKKRWDESDTARDKVEAQAKELFLEEQADEVFIPVAECLNRLDNVLRRFGAALEVERTWEHVGDQRLRRVAKVRSTQSDQLSLDFKIHGVKIFYRDRSYQFSRESEALIRAIVGEVQRFLKPL
jgi:hypothetical protein